MREPLVATHNMEKVGKIVFLGFAVVLVTSTGIIVVKKILDKAKFEAAKKVWDAKQDVVVLHQLPRPESALNTEPLSVKIETFCRLAKIKYICDYEFANNPKNGKNPWISCNGHDVEDSQLSIEYLTKHFNYKEVNLGIKEKAVSKAFRALMEDHLYWILKEDSQKHFQGLTTGEIQKMGVEDLQTLSNFLGSKLYLMGGDNPTEIDCCLFAFLSVILYTFPEDSAYRIVVEKRLGNLLQFTKRMKNNLFPDWDEIVGKNSMLEVEIKPPPARPPPPTNAPKENSSPLKKAPAQVQKTPQQVPKESPSAVKKVLNQAPAVMKQVLNSAPVKQMQNSKPPPAKPVQNAAAVPFKQSVQKK